MDQGAVEICQALNLNRYEFVEVLSRICSSSMDREAIETKSKKLNGSNMR